MSGTATSRARWIILPAIRDHEAWRSAIAAATQAAGLHLIDWDAAPLADARDDPAAILLTKDADAAAAAGADPERTTVVLGAGAPDVEAVPEGASATAPAAAIRPRRVRPWVIVFLLVVALTRAECKNSDK